MTGTAPPSRGYRVSVVVRETVLWLGAGVGLLCLGVAALAVFFGITPLVFRSGSMSPQIPTGALALARTTSAADLQTGDVVSVIRADGERVTHRLVSEKPVGDGRWSLVVKGDANAEADPEPVITAKVDRVFWSVPRVGFLLADVSKPQVVFPAGAVFGILAVVGFRPPLDRRLLRDDVDESDVDDPEGDGDGAGDGAGEGASSPQDPGEAGQTRVPAEPPPGAPGAGPATVGLRDPAPFSPAEVASAYDTRRADPPPSPAGPRPHPAHSKGGIAIGLASLLVASAAAAGLHAVPRMAVPTLAAWSDAGAALSSPEFSAGTLPAPATFTCATVSLTQVQFSWTNPAGAAVVPTSYTITNETTGTAVSTTAQTATMPAPVYTVIGLTPYVYSITANVGTWSAKSSQTRTVTALLSLLPTCV